MAIDVLYAIKDDLEQRIKNIANEQTRQNIKDAIALRQGFAPIGETRNALMGDALHIGA